MTPDVSSLTPVASTQSLPALSSVGQICDLVCAYLQCIPFLVIPICIENGSGPDTHKRSICPSTYTRTLQWFSKWYRESLIKTQRYISPAHSFWLFPSVPEKVFKGLQSFGEVFSLTTLALLAPSAVSHCFSPFSVKHFLLFLWGATIWASRSSCALRWGYWSYLEVSVSSMGQHWPHFTEESSSPQTAVWYTHYVQ